MMEDLICLLHEGSHSLVVANGDVCTFDGRGVSDLYDLFKEDSGFLKGASLADKIVGKAAAALMALAEVREVYADVVSRPALDFTGRQQYFSQLWHNRPAYHQPYKDRMVPAGDALLRLSYSTGLLYPNRRVYNITI